MSALVPFDRIEELADDALHILHGGACVASGFREAFGVYSPTDRGRSIGDVCVGEGSNPALPHTGRVRVEISAGTGLAEVRRFAVIPVSLAGADLAQEPARTERLA